MKKRSKIVDDDIQIITPFLALAQLIREQLKIRMPASKVEVSTVGLSQGSQKKLVIAIPGIANKTEAGFLGFLVPFNRPNVMGSRPEEVLIWIINWDMMRPKLESIYSQNPMWAYFLLDCIDSGDTFTVDGSTTLPASAEEFAGLKAHWTLRQGPSDAKLLPTRHRKVAQIVPANDRFGKVVYTELEAKYLAELAVRRTKANATIAATLTANEEWTKERAVKVTENAAKVEELGDLVGKGLCPEDLETSAVQDWKKAREERRLAAAEALPRKDRIIWTSRRTMGNAFLGL